jgi:hypothetical protein
MAISPSSTTSEAKGSRKARVINLSSGKYVLHLPNESKGDGNTSHKDWSTRYVLEPLAVSRFMDTDFAMGLVTVYQPTQAELRENRALLPVHHLVLEPAVGSEIEEMTAMGQTFKTCKGQGSVSNQTAQKEPIVFFHSGTQVTAPVLYHSVYQAMRYMMGVTDPLRIDEYLLVDRRPLVQEYGRALLEYRIANLERAQAGQEPLRGAEASRTQSKPSRFVK